MTPIKPISRIFGLKTGCCGFFRTFRFIVNLCPSCR